MSWTQVAAIVVIASFISSPLIGDWLHNKRVNREFNKTLVGEAARARKAKIDGWLRDEEMAYLASIGVAQPGPDYSVADAITREDVPFSNDYADQQPQRPQPPRAA